MNNTNTKTNTQTEPEEVDITRQWQKPIQTQHLRESPASYYTFKIWCTHPHWTLKQLAQHTNRKYQQIQEWSYKYKYKARKQAYYESIDEDIRQQHLAIIRNDIEAHLDRQETDKKIQDNDQHLVDVLQSQLLQQLEQGIMPSKEEIQNYTSAKDAYHRGNKEHAATSQMILRNASEGIDLDRVDTDTLSAGAKRFIEAIRERREEQDK